MGGIDTAINHRNADPPAARGQKGNGKQLVSGSSNHLKILYQLGYTITKKIRTDFSLEALYGSFLFLGGRRQDDPN
jgi:hypothetical protein